MPGRLYMERRIRAQNRSRGGLKYYFNNGYGAISLPEGKLVDTRMEQSPLPWSTHTKIGPWRIAKN